MAKASVPRYYVDACVFLSFVEGASGEVDAAESLFQDCEDKKCELFTSQLSIAEVAFAKAEKDGKSLDVEIEAKIDNLWDPSFPLQLVEVHALIVQDAKSMIRQAMTLGWKHRENWALKASDAIHLATAKRHHVNAFLTYDKKLSKFAQMIGYEVREPKPAAGLLFPPPKPFWRPRVKQHWHWHVRQVRPYRIAMLQWVTKRK
jgi:predicted nucleic acid-binding protein